MLESSGVLAYRFVSGNLEVFLLHPGGPFFLRKDRGYWTIPKGLVDDGEDLLNAARREFLEETGLEVSGDFISLGFIVQKGGKRVHGFAVEFDLDSDLVKSNTFEIEWPRGSGRIASFPEADRGEWFDLEMAKSKINSRQAELIDRLMAKLK
ncbi:NUDIX domain-containing protein [Pedobacter sp. Du54]|uniref:NUDIX domain-containing protein n=1 Tax=Pedobacter anseongensis TaxID=3133439 RepID=UPI0030AF138B